MGHYNKITYSSRFRFLKLGVRISGKIEILFDFFKILFIKGPECALLKKCETFPADVVPYVYAYDSLETNQAACHHPD